MPFVHRKITLCFLKHPRKRQEFTPYQIVDGSFQYTSTDYLDVKPALLCSCQKGSEIRNVMPEFSGFLSEVHLNFMAELMSCLSEVHLNFMAEFMSCLSEVHLNL